MKILIIMAIYTKTGDKGETSLANGQRVSKTDGRIEAYGTVDELNSWVGAIRAQLTDGRFVAQNEQLAWIQNKLFNLGAALSEAEGEWITEADVHTLEQWIDAMQKVLPPQKAFLLPAGSELVRRCHLGRTVCRRAERRIVALSEVAQVSPEVQQYVNRLSDFLFVLAKIINFNENVSEIIWEKV